MSLPVVVENDVRILDVENMASENAVTRAQKSAGFRWPDA